MTRLRTDAKHASYFETFTELLVSSILSALPLQSRTTLLQFTLSNFSEKGANKILAF